MEAPITGISICHPTMSQRCKMAFNFVDSKTLQHARSREIVGEITNAKAQYDSTRVDSSNERNHEQITSLI